MRRLQALELLAIFASGASPVLPLPPLCSPKWLHPACSVADSALLRFLSRLRRPCFLSRRSGRPALSRPSCPTSTPSTTMPSSSPPLSAPCQRRPSPPPWALPPCALYTTSLADNVFAPQYLDGLYRILASSSAAWVSQTQVNTVASLIGRSAGKRNTRSPSPTAGILDALATKLAAFAVARGQVVPGASTIAQLEGLADALPEPAPPAANLTVVLEAVAAIIADSRLRACMLLFSPAILAVLPAHQLRYQDHCQRCPRYLDGVGCEPRPIPYANGALGALEQLLPAVPAPGSEKPVVSAASVPTRRAVSVSRQCFAHWALGRAWFQPVGSWQSPQRWPRLQRER